jgi:peptide/nickel transport system substrate-binding protein
LNNLIFKKKNTEEEKMKAIIKIVQLGLLIGLITMVTMSYAGAQKEPIVLRIALSSFGGEQLDPIKESRGVVLQQLCHLYDTWLGIMPDGSLGPGVVKDWEVSKDGLSWTFHLRKGVKFHGDWGEVTAEDLKFSLERFMSPTSTSSGSPALAKKIKEIKIANKYTVQINTHKFELDLPYYLSPHQSTEGIVFSKAYLLQKAGKDWEAQSKLLNRHPIGSGPYKFVERKRGDYVLFEAVKDHWRKTPGFEKLKLILVPEPATRAAMLVAGGADIVEVTGPAVEQVKKAGFEVRNIPNATQAGYLVVGSYWPTPKAKNMPTTNPKVREALSIAINRKEILEHILGGQGSLPATFWNIQASTMDIDAGYFAKLSREAYRYDPKEAKKLLAEAGYPEGFSGIKLFSFTQYGAPWLPDVAEAVAGYWAAIGVKVKIVPTDYGALRPHVVRAKYDDPMSGGHIAIWASAARWIASQSLGIYFQSDKVLKLISSPELDKLIKEIPRVVDKEKRTKMLKQAYRIVNEWRTGEMICGANSLYGVNPKKVGKWQPIAGWSALGRVYETIEAK